jgi:hypothetical protein
MAETLKRRGPMKKYRLKVHLSDGTTVDRGEYDSPEDAQAEIDNLMTEGLRVPESTADTFYPAHAIQKFITSKS